MKKLLFLFILSISFLQTFAQKESSDNKIISNRNIPEREEWLRDLGFGLFIHWGIDSQLGTVISHSMVGASDDFMQRFFHELPQTFDPYKYDPYRMALIAKLAGAKYICLTTKHHSGFCMWDTKTTDFKITNTPYKKDLLKEYVEGARKAGLAVGLYYSPEDFKFLYDNGITIQRGGLTLSSEIQQKYNDLIRRQTRELFTQYGDIDMLFIDGAPKKPCLEEAWKLQPNVVITRGAVNTPEQTIPGAINDRLWESCITMGTQWQYKPTNDNLKSTLKVIEMIVETRAKGGNLLLNIGPKPDGTIPDPEERNLTELAAWNFINQEAIHSIRPWIIPHEEDIWFTASKDRKTVYAIIRGITDWKRGDRKEFIISSVKSTPKTKISVLGQNDKVIEYRNDKDARSKFKQETDGIHISVVRAQRIYCDSKWPNPIVVKLENIEPALVPPIFATQKPQKKDNKIRLKGIVSDMGDAKSLKVGFEWREYKGFQENLNDQKKWNKTETLTINKKGDIEIPFTIAKTGKELEIRMVIYHPNMTLYGDKKQFHY